MDGRREGCQFVERSRWLEALQQRRARLDQVLLQKTKWADRTLPMAPTLTILKIISLCFARAMINHLGLQVGGGQVLARLVGLRACGQSGKD